MKKLNKNDKFINFDYTWNKENINLKKFLKIDFENEDYDDVVDYNKRTFCEYLWEKIRNNQKIINSFFIIEITRPREIKVLIFWLTIELYFLINGLFYSDSYISEVFNSKEKETLFSFVPRSIFRFVYCTFVGNIVGYIIQSSLKEEIEIKKIFIKNKKNVLFLKYEISEILKIIPKKIKILIVINYIIGIFSWYYLSCFNNIYPHMKKEWIISSIFIIIIVQILNLILAFLETSIRYISINCESEKLFKISLLFP